MEKYFITNRWRDRKHFKSDSNFPSLLREKIAKLLRKRAVEGYGTRELPFFFLPVITSTGFYWCKMENRSYAQCPYLQCPQQVWHMLWTYADFRVHLRKSLRKLAYVRRCPLQIRRCPCLFQSLRTFVDIFPYQLGLSFCGRPQLYASKPADVRKSLLKILTLFFFRCGLLRTFWT